MGIDEDHGRKCYDNLSNHAHVEGLGLGLVFSFFWVKIDVSSRLNEYFQKPKPIGFKFREYFQKSKPNGFRVGSIFLDCQFQI